MAKIRVLVFLLTIVIVGIVGTLFALYARGYRFDSQTFKFAPSGILVLRSDPDAAQVFIDGNLKTATNTTISLAPGTYNLTIKKDGYFDWQKQVVVDKEIVTEADISLFKVAPSLSPINFSPSQNPIASQDFTKIVYSVPLDLKDPDKSGLWIIETINLPIGFSRDPRRIMDGDITGFTYEFSPDNRQILLTKKTQSFLIDTGNFTTQASLVPLTPVKLGETIATWQLERQKKLQAQLKILPVELISILNSDAKNIIFSPDETKVLYQASGSAQIRSGLISALPGSSTQKEDRSIKPGNNYVYDIKEDRNFQVLGSDKTSDPLVAINWLPSSKNLIITERNKINIIDYDGTNDQTVYSGAYVAPFAFPFVSTSRLLILTNLGADSNPPNLYSLTIK